LVRQRSGIFLSKELTESLKYWAGRVKEWTVLPEGKSEKWSQNPNAGETGGRQKFQKEMKTKMVDCNCKQRDLIRGKSSCGTLREKKRKKKPPEKRFLEKINTGHLGEPCGGLKSFAKGQNFDVSGKKEKGKGLRKRDLSLIFKVTTTGKSERGGPTRQVTRFLKRVGAGAIKKTVRDVNCRRGGERYIVTGKRAKNENDQQRRGRPLLGGKREKIKKKRTKL